MNEVNPKWHALVAKVIQRTAEYPDWRAGQVLFNALCEVDPELADSIRGTNLDPFHRDARTAGLWAHLGDLWL